MECTLPLKTVIMTNGMEIVHYMMVLLNQMVDGGIKVVGIQT